MAADMSYLRDDLDFSTMKYQPSSVDPSPDSVFSNFWGAENAFSVLTYAPGEYLNEKDESYDCFLEPPTTAGFMDWPGNAAGLVASPIASDISEKPAVAAFNQAPSPSTWEGESFSQANSFGADDSTATALVSEAALATGSKPKGFRGKGKATSSKARPRLDHKSKSVSSASSSASSTTSVKYANTTSGHGGNHNITLRTANRKPKQRRKSEDIGSYSPESPPSSPDAGENLTSEERRARQNHNVVEKQYRNRLNAQFERLLAILPANQPDEMDVLPRHGEFDDRRMSKAEVLEMARRRIHALEKEREELHAERKTLLENVGLMQRAVKRQRLGLVGTEV